MRTAIMLLALIFMSVIALTIFFLAIKEHRSLYAHYAESDLDALSDNMANELLPLLSRERQFFQLKTYLLKLDPYENTQGAAIFDKDWRLLETYIGYQQQHLKQHQQIDFTGWSLRQPGLHREDGHLIAVKAIGDPNWVLGYLVIVRDFSSPLEQSTHSLTWQVLPAATLSILLLMLAFSALGNHWLTPLARLSTMAKTVQKTQDYNVRLPVSGSFEVESLTRDINDMLSAIRQEHELNKQHVVLLEQRRETMEYLANYDHLTGLVNRQFFRKQLETLLKSQTTSQPAIAIMYADLDGFKLVNDSLGHEVGDSLLLNAAKRLKNMLGDSGLVSRHGGDEFLILVQQYENEQELKSIAARIIDALTQKFAIDSWEIRVSASIGIALALPDQDANTIIRNADVAMYEAKHSGKAQYSFFNAEMMVEHQRRIEVANAIDSAIANGELFVVYQPKHLCDGSIVGAEALLRWQSPQLGFVSPGEFIPIAEQSGKVSQLTQWIINRVCADIEDALLPLGFHHPIAINLSAADLKKYHMLGSIKGAVQKYSIDAGQLEFEVTEHSYLDDFDTTNRFLSDIADMGYSIALDDFGTGYSSLSYLNRIPIDTLKIDKQFVDHIGQSQQDDALVLTIIEMGKRLGMQLCAEGVESKAQLDFLAASGCQFIQGYYFSKPMPLNDLCERLWAAKRSAP
ncbi:putative bifunctional diguanylate cyclase/phosphodiesterase [Bacterioplanes sanyensis]|nr:EAL domain-containing protein [Bacterioplanes sanyensis]